MRRRLARVLVLFAALSASHAVASPECDRPLPDNLYAYKEAYVPVSFAPEPFGMEVLDLVILAGVMVVGAWFSLKRRPSGWLALLMLGGFVYFGLVRGGCICPVGATTNACMGLAAPELIGKVVAWLFLLPLFFAFFVGRVFCSSACPLGALQHLLSRRKGYVLPRRLNAVLRLLPVALLAATIWGALRGGMFIACKLDVYKLIFFTGHAWIDQLVLATTGALTEPRLLLIGDVGAWLTLASALAIGVVVPRPFCRFFCPYGVLLGVVSKLGLRRRRITAAGCVTCRRCVTMCPVQAIAPGADGDTPVISDFHCIQCGRCDDACAPNTIRG